MASAGVTLCVHGEVVDAEVDMFDREREFIHRKLAPVLERVPGLRVVMEHITTQDAAEFVATAGDNVAASITPQVRVRVSPCGVGGAGCAGSGGLREGPRVRGSRDAPRPACTYDCPPRLFPCSTCS